MTFFGRQVIMTTLDPVPRSMRASPGYFVMNERERRSLEDEDGDILKELGSIALAETAFDAINRRRH